MQLTDFTNKLGPSAFYTREELAKTLRISLRTMDKLLIDKAIPHIRVGRVVRIPVSSLYKLCQSFK